MQKVNQCALVLNQLMKSGRITAAQAKELGIKSLAARVKELRMLGVPIESSIDGGYSFPYWLQKAKARKKKDKAGNQPMSFDNFMK